MSIDAFDGCLNLKELIIEDGSEPLSFSSTSFWKCPLELLYIGRNITTPSPFLNINKANLSSIVISHFVTSIEDKTFEGACFQSSSLQPYQIPQKAPVHFQGLYLPHHSKI